MSVNNVRAAIQSYRSGGATLDEVERAAGSEVGSRELRAIVDGLGPNLSPAETACRERMEARNRYFVETYVRLPGSTLLAMAGGFGAQGGALLLGDALILAGGELVMAGTVSYALTTFALSAGYEVWADVHD